MRKLFKNKIFIKYTVTGVLFFSVFSIIFNIAVTDNPNFNIYDLCLNLLSELLGLFIILLIVDNYLGAVKEYRQELIQQRTAVKNKPEINKNENNFEITGGDGSCNIKSVTTLRDKQTGVHYLLITHEYGSALTPLLNKEYMPVKD